MSSKANGKIKYQFIAKIWQHQGQGSWHFVSLPRKLAKEIRDNLQSAEEGWGRLKATAKLGNAEWDTAIWFDTKSNTYLLPLKAEIRKKEKLKADQEVHATIWI